MVNYYKTTRINHFSVKDEEKFRKLMSDVIAEDKVRL